MKEELKELFGLAFFVGGFVSVLLTGLIVLSNKAISAIEWIILAIDWSVVEPYVMNFLFSIDIVQVIAIILMIKVYWILEKNYDDEN